MSSGGAARLVVTVATLIALATANPQATMHAARSSTIQAPVLKWQRGGCFSSWCETGWYSSPAVADLDGDGSAEVIASAYTIFVLDGKTGALEWSVKSGHDRSEPDGSNVGRTWPGVVVADMDDDGSLEIVTAHSGGYVSMYDQDGYFEAGWPQRPTTGELRGLSVYDLEGDGTLEVVVTAAVGSGTSTWVYEHNGALRPGWPQLSSDTGYAAGVYNDNAAIGDLDRDGMGEIVVPSDVHYICAYEANGAHIPAHPMYAGKNWGQVGVWESPATELRGWGTCDAGDGRAERYRANFAHGPATIADVDGDCKAEVVAAGNVYDCIGGYPSRYSGVYVFNADRSRFVGSGYDWTNPPTDTGAPLSEDYRIIENAQPNPVVADLDGDGRKEILFASYDGRVHAFWLDKTEHHDWPYSVYSPGEGFYRFASEPVVADLDGDGRYAEVVFASWAQKSTNQTGRLHILDYQGHLLYQVNLPAPYGGTNWNGALPAPTLADIDGDADLEAVLNTAHSGVVAYDLPGTANARVLWGTGRGNYHRNGSTVHNPLQGSAKNACPVSPRPGDVLTYTVVLCNPGPALPGVRLTDTLPAQVSYWGNLWASGGTYGQAGGVITWTGTVPASPAITITYAVRVEQAIVAPLPISNVALIADGLGSVLSRQATVIVNGRPVYLPLTRKP